LLHEQWVALRRLVEDLVLDDVRELGPDESVGELRGLARVKGSERDGGGPLGAL
jgi:hypothetical protein